MTVLPTRAECLDRAAQIYLDGLADRDAMTPRDAAIAAGASTDAEIDALADRIRQHRQPQAQPA